MKSTATQLLLPAPAKLNLFLHITGRREDGYHLLQTVFQLLDYSDEVHLTLRQDGKITRIKNNKWVVDIPFENDLCVRAARLIHQQLTETQRATNGVEIALSKKLPIGGGIGGGSSDAATVLCGLNKLWDCQFNADQLAELGAQIGADVPVFVRGHTAWAEGIGEQLTALTLKEEWFVVIHPNIFVSTAEIFTDQGLTRDCDSLTISRFLKGNRQENFFNVFESLVTKKHPEIADAIDWLSTYSQARLTGTGSCIFASFESESSANNVLDALAKSSYNWSGFVAKGVNDSPLISALQN